MMPTPERAPSRPPARLRVMTAADVPEVAAIEARSSPAPWGSDIFRSCLRPDYLCLVLERRGAVAGFAIASHGAGEGHLLNLAVHPDERARGFGRQLLDAMLARLARYLVEVVFLEVRCSNTVAISLYRRAGFVPVNVRTAYYATRTGREDALTMKRELGR